jgi:uncharacterized protein (TIGR03435 family)
MRRPFAVLCITVSLSMAELLSELEPNVDKPIVDRTGLAGVYQFTLQLPRDEVRERALRALGVRVGSSTLGGTEPRSGASVFKSLESLGLRLERRTVSVEMIVVDKVSRTPTAN